jgi:phosphate transport system permease protein
VRPFLTTVYANTAKVNVVLLYLFLAIAIIATSAYFLGLKRSLAVVDGRASELHSRPGYYAAFVAAWTFIPAFVFILLWLMFQPMVIDRLVLATFPAERIDNLSSGQISLLLAEIRQIARGNIFGTPDEAVLAAAQTFITVRETAQYLLIVLSMSLAVTSGYLAWSQIGREFRARQGVERILAAFMIFCSTAAILTTAGIVLSLAFETFRFFERVPVFEFLFGLNWEPQIALRADQALSGGGFGAVPVFLGTLQIAMCAMAVAIPLGLFTAIYLSEYADSRSRAVVKPVIEILAGIPTVVYGFFAVLVVAPAMREFGETIGVSIAPNSAVAAGAVMGIMLIPFISSLSDDAITAVPRSLREGSYVLGATRGETITKVLLPAALPGIMGGILLATSRAIGETMIVVMAAGIIANLTANPLEPVTTVTVQIVTLLIGDTEFDNPKTLAAFALGLVLFLATLALNVLALRIVQKYRERYD